MSAQYERGPSVGLENHDCEQPHQWIRSGGPVLSLGLDLSLDLDFDSSTDGIVRLEHTRGGSIVTTNQLRNWAVPRVSPLAALAWAAVIALQLGLVLAYVSVRDPQLSLFHIYPFIWINLGLCAIWKIKPVSAGRRERWIAGVVAAGYFLVIGYFSGLFYPGRETSAQNADFVYGLDIAVNVPPGYGPAIFYSSPNLSLSLLPYLVIGYVALSYLVYVTILDASGTAIPGVLGVFTCVGCSWPIIAAILAGTGASGSLAATIYGQSAEISTAAFILTVGLLAWRPFDR